jgi:hypothetical protein
MGNIPRGQAGTMSKDNSCDHGVASFAKQALLLPLGSEVCRKPRLHDFTIKPSLPAISVVKSYSAVRNLFLSL